MEYGQQGQHGHGTTGRVDQYGDPVSGVGHGTTGTGMGYGTGTGIGGMGPLGEHGGAGMGGGQFQPARDEHKNGDILHRSGSSSSSSSEDDSMGRRRKKGMVTASMPINEIGSEQACTVEDIDLTRQPDPSQIGDPIATPQQSSRAEEQIA